MELGAGYGSLAVAFVLLAGVMAWVMIHSPGHFLLKALLIPPILWYGVALFYSAQNLMGWPVAQSIPEEARLLAVRVDEPDPGRKDTGAIYLWVSQPPKSGEAIEKASLSPRRFFAHSGSNEPRAYKLPYSRDLHQSIARAKTELQTAPGSQMQIRRNGRAAGNPADGRSDPSLSLELVRPEPLPPKDGGLGELQPPLPQNPPH